MSISREFDLIINAGTSSPLVINANQNDSGETWLFNLYQEDGTKVTPLAGQIVGLKTDGHAIINAGTVNASGQVVITETEQITACPGANVFELVFDSVHGTANFILLVEKSPVDDDADLSESDISAINQAIAMAIDSSTVQAIQQGLENETAARIAAVSAEASTRAAADTSEAATRAAADASLREAIDAMVSPSGQSVVVDSSLSISGAAADAKVTGDEISDLNSALSHTDECFDSSFWRNKGINISTGVTADNTTRLSLIDKYSPSYDGDLYFYTNVGYQFYVVFYKKTDSSYVGYAKTGGGTTKTNGSQWLGNSYVLTKNYINNYKVVFILRKVDNGDITADEAINFKFGKGNYLPVFDKVFNGMLEMQGIKNADVINNSIGTLYKDSSLWEIGAVSATVSGWTYVDGYDSRIRLKKGNFLLLKKGDRIRLTDYTNARFYVGYRFNENYAVYAGWRTADLVLTDDGEYTITVARPNDTTPISSVSDLLDLLVIDKVQNFFNVREYGATGDGTTEDATAIQSALNACNAFGGGTVYFPAGTYNVKSQLIFYSNTHVLLDPGATILRGAEVNGVFYSHCTDETLLYNGVHDVVFEGGTIDLGTGISMGGVGIGVIHGNNITIKDMTIKHVNKGYHACDICCSKDVRIVNCIIKDLLTNSEYAECIQIDSADQRTSFPSPELTDGANTFDSTPTVNVEITGCRFELNNYSPALGNHNSIANKRILFHDNIIVGAGGSRGAIAFDHYVQYYPDPNATTDVLIHHNIFEGCTYGFLFGTDNTGHFYVRDNIFQDIGTLKINPSATAGEFLNNIELNS